MTLKDDNEEESDERGENKYIVTKEKDVVLPNAQEPTYRNNNPQTHGLVQSFKG